MSIRSFIAIKLSAAIKDELAGLQDELKGSNSDVKWVRSGIIHLTLKFLGEIAEDKAAEVKNVLKEVSSRHNPFKISLSDIGGFPGLAHPRVIWVGIDAGSLEAQALAREIDEGLSQIGFEKETRPFTSHLTIGRVRSGRGLDRLVSKIKTLNFTSKATCGVNKVILFQSTLSQKGALHTPLYEATLG